jgi:hypothetical protein
LGFKKIMLSKFTGWTGEASRQPELVGACGRVQVRHGNKAWDGEEWAGS